MDTAFDPYRKWLGIPPQYQPPNHYRLLGIEMFESDPDVIAHAADQRAVHLKTFATGANGALSQKLLNEVSAARVCLLNPVEKARYDATLRNDKAAADSGSIVVPHSPPKRAPAIAAAPAATAAVAAPNASSPWRLWAICGSAAALVLLLVVVGLVAALAGPAKDETADGKPQPPASNTIVPKPVDDRPTNPTKADDLPVGMLPAPPPPGPHTLADLMGSENPEDDPAATPPETKPDEAKPDAPVPADDGEEKPKGKPPRPPKTNPPVRNPPPKDPSLADLVNGEEKPVEKPPVARVAAPSDEYVANKEKEFREVYKDKLQQATTADAKRTLARDVSKLAGDTKDPSEQYVLLHVASQLAADAEELDEAMGIVNRMEAAYLVNGCAKKAALLTQVSSLGPKITPALNLKMLALAQRLADESKGNGEIAAAIECTEVAMKAAQRAKDLRLRTTLEKNARELEQLKAQQALANKAEERLATEPDNPKANAALGVWMCFVCDNWQKGLPHLAKGDDTLLSALAVKDMAAPTDAKQQVALGDDWWKASDERKGIEQIRIRAHAAGWYRKAMKGLTGLELKQLEKQLDEKGLRVKQYALKFNGKSSVVGIETFRYDGSYPITLEVIARPLPEADDDRGRTALLGNLCDYSTGLSLTTYYGSYTLTIAAGGIYETYGTSSTSRTMLGRPTLPNEWVHVAGVYDGQEVRLYVRGQQEGSRAVPAGHKPSIVPFVVGASYTQPRFGQPPVLGGFYTGMIRAVRVSVGPRYLKNFKPVEEFVREPTTRLLFNFNEGKGNQLKDASGNKHVGTIIGAEWEELEPILRIPGLH